jgi:hypothetical protein
VLTFAVDDKVRKCANVLEDSVLLGKLAQGDMIATEAKYHPSCIMNLYYRARRQSMQEDVVVTQNYGGCECDSLEFAEVVAYIEENKLVEIAPPVFMLSELTKLYSTYLIKYKVTTANAKANSSRFKERLLDNVPNLSAITYGREVLLTFSDNVGVALQGFRERASSDADAILLMRTAKLIRNEIFSPNCEFSMDLTTNSQSLPQGLLY